MVCFQKTIEWGIVRVSFWQSTLKCCWKTWLEKDGWSKQRRLVDAHASRKTMVASANGVWHNSKFSPMWDLVSICSHCTLSGGQQHSSLFSSVASTFAFVKYNKHIVQHIVVNTINEVMATHTVDGLVYITQAETTCPEKIKSAQPHSRFETHSKTCFRYWNPNNWSLMILIFMQFTGQCQWKMGWCHCCCQWHSFCTGEKTQFPV